MAVGADVRHRFGALIRQRRTSSEPVITQRSLAASVGTTQAAISQFEKGVTFPSAETFFLLVQALHIDMGEVLEAMAGSAEPVTPLIYTVGEAAALLGISERYAYELVEQGRLPAVTWGRKRVVPRVAVQLILAEAMRGFDPKSAMEGTA